MGVAGQYPAGVEVGVVISVHTMPTKIDSVACDMCTELSCREPGLRMRRNYCGKCSGSALELLFFFGGWGDCANLLQIKSMPGQAAYQIVACFEAN